MITQFQWVCRELDINLNRAQSPGQGQSGNPFGTFQDRLVKELRLRNISTVEETNEFLDGFWTKDYDKRFSVKPKNKTDLHAN